MSICALCLKDRELRNSHIVPEFLYSDLYNENDHMMGVSGRGQRGWKALQKGIREHMLCEDCEQHINKYYEKPFFQTWVIKPPLPDPWDQKKVYWISVDYRRFKLFHLSVLFRAGVSTLPTFSAVNLGPHTEKLRKLLLDCNPGEAWQYPIFGYAVIHHRTKRLVQMVSCAEESRLGGRRCYGMMYGGVQWWIGVASDRNPEFEKVALRSDGKMPFTAMPWNEVGAVQRASVALKNGFS